jgi:hypothetical protein
MVKAICNWFHADSARGRMKLSLLDLNNNQACEVIYVNCNPIASESIYKIIYYS